MFTKNTNFKCCSNANLMRIWVANNWKQNTSSAQIPWQSTSHWLMQITVVQRAWLMKISSLHRTLISTPGLLSQHKIFPLEFKVMILLWICSHHTNSPLELSTISMQELKVLRFWLLKSSSGHILWPFQIVSQPSTCWAIKHLHTDLSIRLLQTTL